MFYVGYVGMIRIDTDLPWKKYGYPPQNCGMSDQFPCQYEYIELCVWLCLCDVIDRHSMSMSMSMSMTMSDQSYCLWRPYVLWLCWLWLWLCLWQWRGNYILAGGAKCGNTYILIYPILLCSAASSWRGARGVSGASPTDAHIHRAPVQTRGPSLPLATWPGTRWFGLCVERITLSTRGAPKGTGL